MFFYFLLQGGAYTIGLILKPSAFTGERAQADSRANCSQLLADTQGFSHIHKPSIPTAIPAYSLRVNNDLFWPDV